MASTSFFVVIIKTDLFFLVLSEEPFLISYAIPLFLIMDFRTIATFWGPQRYKLDHGLKQKGVFDLEIVFQKQIQCIGEEQNINTAQKGPCNTNKRSLR